MTENTGNYESYKKEQDINPPIVAMQKAMKDYFASHDVGNMLLHDIWQDCVNLPESIALVDIFWSYKWIVSKTFSARIAAYIEIDLGYFITQTHQLPINE